MKLIAGNSNLELAKSISSYIDVELAKASIRSFADGEISVKINENLFQCRKSIRIDEKSSTFNEIQNMP